jgi:hypothetical protein
MRCFQRGAQVYGLSIGRQGIAARLIEDATERKAGLMADAGSVRWTATSWCNVRPLTSRAT